MTLGGGLRFAALTALQSGIFEIARLINPLRADLVYRVFPLLSMPLFYPGSTKLDLVQRMIRHLRAGRKVFLLCHAQIAEAAEAFSRQLRNGTTMLEGKPTNQHGRILREWQSHAKAEAEKLISRIGSKPHWVLADEILVSGQTISLTLVHQGNQVSLTALPLDGFLVHFIGYVSASPCPGSVAIQRPAREAPF